MSHVSLADYFADPANHAPRPKPAAHTAPSAAGEEAPLPVNPETGRVRVMSDKCGDCIGRAGNPKNLSPERLRELLGLQEDGTYDEGWTVCHSTLEGNPDDLPPSVCAWIAQHPKASPRSLIMRMAARNGIDYIQPTETP
ncbi:hypothetical protein ACWGQT_00655 [Streptomyces yangpuensis]